MVAPAAEAGHLVEQRDVEGEPELVLQPDLVRQLVTQLPRRGRRVRQQRLGVPVHEGDRQHDRLLRLGRLQVKICLSYEHIFRQNQNIYNIYKIKIFLKTFTN